MADTEARWKPYFPLGFPDAINSATTIAAPLLASVTVGLVVFVAASAHTVRHPSLALLLLVLAFFALVGSVQFGFHALQYAVTPNQIQEWFPGNDTDSLTLARQNQRYYWDSFSNWARRARHAYDTGIVALLLAVVVLVIPSGHITNARAAVIALAGVGCAAELGWMAHRFRHRNDQGPEFPDVGPEPFFISTGRPDDG